MLVINGVYLGSFFGPFRFGSIPLGLRLRRFISFRFAVLHNCRYTWAECYQLIGMVCGICILEQALVHVFHSVADVGPTGLHIVYNNPGADQQDTITVCKRFKGSQGIPIVVHYLACCNDFVHLTGSGNDQLPKLLEVLEAREFHEVKFLMLDICDGKEMA